MVPCLGQDCRSGRSVLHMARDDILLTMVANGVRNALYRRFRTVSKTLTAGFSQTWSNDTFFRAICVACTSCGGLGRYARRVCLVYTRHCTLHREGMLR